MIFIYFPLQNLPTRKSILSKIIEKISCASPDENFGLAWENFFYYKSIFVFILQIIFNRMLLCSGKFWSRNALAEIKWIKKILNISSTEPNIHLSSAYLSPWYIYIQSVPKDSGCGLFFYRIWGIICNFIPTFILIFMLFLFLILILFLLFIF